MKKDSLLTLILFPFHKKTFFKFSLKRGFTLLEMMIVLVILGALMSIFIVSFDFGDNEEQIKLHNLAAKAQLQSALFRFRQTCGNYPTQGEGLSVLHKSGDTSPAEENCPSKNYILNKNMLLDFYKNPYSYRVDDDASYVIMSLGSDGQEGGEGKNKDIDLSEIE